MGRHGESLKPCAAENSEAPLATYECAFRLSVPRALASSERRRSRQPVESPELNCWH